MPVSTSPKIGCEGLLDDANLERFKIECASLPVVSLGSYKMLYKVLRLNLMNVPEISDDALGLFLNS